jgi:hypothetical protein
MLSNPSPPNRLDCRAGREKRPAAVRIDGPERIRRKTGL